MWRSLLNTLRLTGKELRAIRRDTVMLVLIFYVFTVATYMVADAISTEINDLAVAVVDEDQSTLSHRLTDAIQPPLFKHPVSLTPAQAEQALKYGDYILVVSFPPKFESDLLSGHAATLSIDVDATAVAHAGNGAAFMQELLAGELSTFFTPNGSAASLVDVVFRNRFNPNLTSKWFTSVMQLMNSVTILTLILAGASLIREREHGTIEHVLVMPVRPHEIVFSKILANGAVILGASVFSLLVVIQWLIGVPLAQGVLPLFIAGTAIYVIAVASIGLLLSTFTHTMGQFGLLIIPVIIVMILLSGGMTPMESMPGWLRVLMQLISPAPHFVAFTQSVLYRGAGLALVAWEIAAMAAMAAMALAVALARFRRVLAN
ncbi:ABC transporter permease [Sinirhodobacter ferrireducens]|uniref:ABC transporter permease n=1 Tax=Paenirhodobacter ferrireducens TaxID=1215032 RepID=A0A443LQL8_9RHOB|nr:ABC transporter permease [Sinirhodobacter ferrireducens]RWR51462.1 ABC transporter permease [Sinirhodobacter ferrireducens]